MRRLERGRIFEFLEIVFIRAIPHVHFGWKRFATLLALLPASVVAFIEVMAAQSVAVVITMAGIPSIGKHDVIVFVIANQIVTARRAC